MSAAKRFLILLLLLVTACYSYRPFTRPGVRGGDEIRLILTDSGAVTLASQLGPRTEEVSGRIMQDSAGAYVLSVLETRHRGGPTTDWRGEHVAVPHQLVARAEERRFSRRRTALAAAALLASAIAAREALWGPGGVFGGAPPGGAPPHR